MLLRDYLIYFLPWFIFHSFIYLYTSVLIYYIYLFIYSTYSTYVVMLYSLMLYSKVDALENIDISHMMSHMTTSEHCFGKIF